MKIAYQSVFILISDDEESERLTHLLKEAGFLTRTIGSPDNLKELLSKNSSCTAIILDIDSVAVDNRIIRDLSSTFPSAPLLCLSKERLHPELEDSIRDHIYACLTKPADPDELIYWLKCIQEDEKGVTAG